MRSLFIILYTLLALVSLNAAKRLGEDQVIADTGIDLLDNDFDVNGVSRRALTVAPTRGQTGSVVTREPTKEPDQHCISFVGRTTNLTFACGEPIKLRFNYKLHKPVPAAKVDDRIGIYPCYITDFKRAEVWQWACGGPPNTPKTCTGPRTKGLVTFNKVPKYNHGGQVWPLTANYNKERKMVNHCFKVVIMRNDREPYTPVCHSPPITVHDNSKPGCAIRLKSPTD